jgi:Fur family transcriptional regulator, ferric uptake regulator
MPLQRNTGQRDAIRQVFTLLGRPLSPQEVLVEARKSLRRIGQATVYRTIKAFVDEGWLTVVDLPGEWARYEIAGHGHHHHFACRSCRRVFDLPGCCGHLHVDLPAGFAAESHDVVVYGRCEDCGPQAPQRPETKPRRIRSPA